MPTAAQAFIKNWFPHFHYYRLIRQVWNTTRTVQYGQSLFPKLPGSNCTPQGCPLAPCITLVSWMVSGHFTEWAAVGTLHTTFNRLAQASTWMTAVSVILMYIEKHRPSGYVGWKEQQGSSLWKPRQNSVKATRTFTTTKASEWTQHSEIKVLGITRTTKRRQSSKTEVQRLNRATLRINLITVTLFCSWSIISCPGCRLWVDTPQAHKAVFKFVAQCPHARSKNQSDGQ